MHLNGNYTYIFELFKLNAIYWLYPRAIFIYFQLTNPSTRLYFV